MRAAVDLDQAVRLHRAEAQWLRQSAARIRAAHARAEQEAAARAEADR